MAFIRPTLPPKAGYVEVELDDGRRTYKNVKTGVLIENETPVTSDSTEPTTDEILDALLGVTADE